MELVASLIGLVAMVALAAIVWRACVAVTRDVVSGAGGVAAAFTLGVLAIAPMHLGAWLHTDLRGGSLVLALVCAPLAWRSRHQPAPRPTAALWRAWLVLLAALGPVAVLRRMFDEAPGHRPLVAAAARGVLPIEHPRFAGEPFIYHLGFDGLAGWVSAFTGLDATRAIDVATLALLCALAWVFADVLEVLLARAPGTAEVAAVVALHSPFALWGHAVFEVVPPGASWFTAFQDPNTALPPPVSTFFQHPQALGLPLAYAALCLARAADSARARVLLAVTCVLLGQAHAVFFAVAGLVLGGDAVLASRPLADRALRVLWLLAALAASLALGGLGASQGGMVAWGGLWGRDTPLGFVLHLPLPLAVVAWTLARARRADRLERMLVACVVVGLVVATVLHYPATWDIVKFYQLACLIAVPVAVQMLVALHARAPRGALVLAGALSVTSVVWLLRFGLLNGATLPGGFVFKHHDEAPVHPAALALEPLLAAHVAPRDRVVTTAPVIADLGYFVFGGADPAVEGRGFVIDAVSFDADRQLATLACAELTPRLLHATHVRWALLPLPMIAETVSPALLRAWERAAVGGLTLDGTPWALFDLRALEEPREGS